jgi:hypothetical protein
MPSSNMKIMNFHFVSHHHDISVMELGHLLTRSGLTCPEASSKVCHDSFCQSGSNVSLRWVIYVYYEALRLQVVSSVLVFQSFVQNWSYF